MIQLSEKWAPQLLSEPETGMGYQIVSIVLKSGKTIEQAMVVGGQITKVRGFDEIPFAEDDIREIIVTHDKWDWPGK
jgi:hypothetical protein